MWWGWYPWSCFCHCYSSFCYFMDSIGIVPPPETIIFTSPETIIVDSICPATANIGIISHCHWQCGFCCHHFVYHFFCFLYYFYHFSYHFCHFAYYFYYFEYHFCHFIHHHFWFHCCCWFCDFGHCGVHCRRTVLLHISLANILFIDLTSQFAIIKQLTFLFPTLVKTL